MPSPAVTQARAWYWQRISAMVLTLFVGIHLAIMIIAIHGGLTAAEILGRTQGSLAFGLFYALFVLACAVHVPIGVAKIAQEWGQVPPGPARWIARVLTAAIVGMGFAAVWGVNVA